MIRMLIVDPKPKEREALHREAKEQAALLTEEDWKIWVRDTWNDREKKEGEWLDIAYLDVTGQDGIRMAEQIRKACSSVFMVLIVSQKLSPLYYLKPSVMAASILMRPFSTKMAKDSIREAISWLPLSDTEQKDVFIIAGRDGKVRIPYQKILYFEARAKKIYAALETEEYGFYDSMEHLMEKLPNGFCRCHRSFVINTRHIDKLQAGAGICLLNGNIEIPISRSYKQNVREYFR